MIDIVKMTDTYSFQELNIDPDHIGKAMGFDIGKSPENISDLIDEVIDDLGDIDDIRSEYHIYNDISLDQSNGILKVGQLELSIRKIISSQIRKTEQLAVFLCTAGKEVGELSSKLMKEGDLLKGYIYDVIGSVIAEDVADRMQDQLRNKMLESGLGISNRFSPGYCGWDVSDQHKLFSLLPDNFCNISLTESALMYPIKSISGIIGIGKEVVCQPYSCNRCDEERCIYRERRIY